MKTKILIVDDEERVRKIYLRIFQAAASSIFEVYEAPDALRAGEIIVSENIDLVLLDIKMPGVRGTTLNQAIREYNPNIKIIVASVFPLQEQKVLIPDADIYYDKSQGPLVLLRAVTGILETKQRYHEGGLYGF